MEWDSKLKDFFVSNDETKIAVCNLCSKNVSFKNSALNLIQHLALSHHESLINNFSVVISNDEESPDSIPMTITCDSWSIFEAVEGSTVATCSLCQQEVSYKTSRSNLEQHLKLNHSEIYKNFISSKSKTPVRYGKGNSSDYVSTEVVLNSKEEQVILSDEENIMFLSNKDNPTRKNKSILWEIFDKDHDSKMAICTFCQKNMSYKSTTASLKNHIRRIHPLIFKKYFVSSKSLENGSEGNNPDEEISQVDKHLENFDNSVPDSPKVRNRSNSSKVWKVFNKIESTKTATCSICNKDMSYKTTTANLKSHIRRRHPLLYYKLFTLKLATLHNESEVESESENNSSNEENSDTESSSEDEHLFEYNLLNPPKLPRKNISALWNFFKRIQGTKLSTCNLCGNVISFKSSTGNLKVHLKRKHTDIYNKNFTLPKLETHLQIGSKEVHVCKETNSEVELLPTDKALTNNIDIWQYYTKVKNTKMATCTLCQRNMSFKSTSGNLRSHLRRVHPKTYYQVKHISSKSSPQNCLEGNNENLDEDNSFRENNFKETNSLYNISKVTRKNRSDLWNYFNKIRGTNMATCSVCKRKLSYKSTRANLRNHLMRKHPDIYTSSQLSKGSEMLSEGNHSEDENFLVSNKSTTESLNMSNTPRLIKKYIRNMNKIKHFKDKYSNAYTNLISKSLEEEPPPKNIYEVYISTTEEQDQGENIVKENTVLDFDNTKQSKTIGGDNKLIHFQVDPFDNGEIINVEPPKKMQRVNSSNYTLQIHPDDKKYIDRCLLKLITEDFQPLSIIEDKGFQEFVAVLNPNYQLPTKKTLSVILAEEYTSRLAEYKEISQDCLSISLSLDWWSSSNMHNFMTVTAHYIDQNTFEFCSVLIQCAALHAQHTAEKISTELNQVTSKWDISNKVKFIVSDNESNMVSAAQNLNWPHFACYARKFNLVLQEAFNDNSIAKIVSKVQETVAYFKSSSKAKQMLNEYQINTQHMTESKSLLLAIPNHWITICKMLKRCSELQDAVRATISNISEEIPSITSEEWQCIEQLVEVLNPFEEAATIMSSEKYLIAGKAIVLTSGLYKVCTDLAERQFDEPVSNLILKLKNGLSTNFGDIENNEEISVCTLLDPRFKQHAFEDQTAMLNAKQRVMQKLKQLNYTECTVSSVSTSSAISNPDSSLLGRFYNKVASSYQPEVAQQKTMDELDRYLSENVIPLTECALKWWKERRMLYPALSKVFIACSNIVVTSIPCEKAFSKSGYILSDRLTRLTTSKADKIMYLNVNK